MRNLIIGAAALLAVVAPSIASADTGGELKLTYATVDEETDTKENVVALSGVVITDLDHAGWRLQINGGNADLDHDSHGDAFSQIEVHAVYDMGQFQLGAFTGNFNKTGTSYWEYGVEAAMNFERGQVAVSAAAATSPNNDGVDDLSTIAASGTFMLTESIGLGATVSSTDFDNNGGDVDSWGVNASYAIPNSRFTVAIGYRTSDAEFYSDDEDFVGVSLAWNFGEGAQGRTMQGASALLADAIAAQ